MSQNMYPYIEHVKKHLGMYLFTVHKQISLYWNETLDMVMFCCLTLVSIASGHIRGSLFYALTIEVGKECV
jgi:hypothetical protein